MKKFLILALVCTSNSKPGLPLDSGECIPAEELNRRTSMSKKDEALELALEALTIQSDRVTEIGKRREAIADIKEALAEQPAQQQEPVDVVWFEDNNGASRKSPKDCQSFGANGVPAAVWVNGVRYTSPPASKPWVGLTLDDREKLRDQFEDWNYPSVLLSAVENILREKNNG